MRRKTRGGTHLHVGLSRSNGNTRWKMEIYHELSFQDANVTDSVQT